MDEQAEISGPAPGGAPPAGSGYRAAIDAMIARYDQPGASSSLAVPPGLASGLAELCARLLERYERLSVLNRYAEPAIGPLEHLRLLALLDERANDPRSAI